MTTSVSTQRYRRYPPARYPEQLITMATPEMAAFVRTRAIARRESYTEVLRDLIQRGIDTLDGEVDEDLHEVHSTDDPATGGDVMDDDGLDVTA